MRNLRAQSPDAASDVPDYENYDYKAQWIDRSIEDRAEKELIASLLPGGRDCLELGGGFGRITPAIEQCFSTVVMVDYSVKSLRTAQRRIRKASLLRCDIRTLPFDDDSFDSVVAIRVLHHIKNLEELIGEIVRVCRDGATVVFAVPNSHYGLHGIVKRNQGALFGQWNHIAYVHSLEEYRHPRMGLVEIRGSGIFDNRIGRRLKRFPSLSKLDTFTSRAWRLKSELFLKYRVAKGHGSRRERLLARRSAPGAGDAR